MGIGIRVFLVDDDDSIKRLPLTRYERLARRDPKERLPQHAGKRVRFAERGARACFFKDVFFFLQAFVERVDHVEVWLQTETRYRVFSLGSGTAGGKG